MPPDGPSRSQSRVQARLRVAQLSPATPSGGSSRRRRLNCRLRWLRAPRRCSSGNCNRAVGRPLGQAGILMDIPGKRGKDRVLKRASGWTSPGATLKGGRAAVETVPRCGTGGQSLRGTGGGRHMWGMSPGSKASESLVPAATVYAPCHLTVAAGEHPRERSLSGGCASAGAGSGQIPARHCRAVGSEPPIPCRRYPAEVCPTKMSIRRHGGCLPMYGSQRALHR